MRSLAVFFYRNVNLFLFLLLEGFCLYLLFSNNNFHRASFISSSNRIAGDIFTTVNNTREYFYLKEANANLADENARLRGMLKDAYNRVNTKDFVVNDTLHKLQYKYITAKIVNNSVNKRNNFLTLNIGSKQGVTAKMGVITSNGIIGFTKQVSENYTSVLSILNKDAKTSASLKNNGNFGSLYWEGGDYRFATLADIPAYVEVKAGDTVVTNQYSSMFPDNLMIGTIDKVYIKPGENFYTLKVKLSANLKNVTYVYVIKDLLREEKVELENKTQNDR